MKNLSLSDGQIERIEELADNIIRSLAIYFLIKEFVNVENSSDENDFIYKKFILSMLTTFNDTNEYEH